MKRPKVWNIRVHMLVLAVVCLVLAAVTWLIEPVVSYILTPCALAYGVYVAVRLQSIRRHMRGTLTRIASQLDPARQEMLLNFPIPMMAVGSSRRILWYSESFQTEVLGKREMIGESFGKLTNLALDEFCRKEVPLQIGEKSYHVRGLHPGQVDIPDAGADKPVKAGDEDFYLLYFIDVTEMDKEAAE